MDFLHSRWINYIMAGILTLSFIYHYTRIYDVKPDMNGDNIVYYSLGKALSSGKGFSNIMSLQETPHTHFPPGYPVFIAGIMKLFPDNIQAVKIANGVLLYASILLLFFLFTKLSGNRPFIAFTSCLLCTLHTEILRYATIMMSEMLFLFCSVIVIWLTLRIKAERIFTRKGAGETCLLVLLLAFMNYVYFVRTMGTSLILAVIIYSGIVFVKRLWYWWKNERQTNCRQSLVVVLKHGLVFILLLVSFIGAKSAWDIRNRQAGKVSMDYIHDFKKKPGGQVMTTWKDWSTRIQNNFKTYSIGWIPAAVLKPDYTLNKKPTGKDIFIGIVTLTLIIAGLFGLKEGKLLLFLYIGGTMAVLLVWPEQFGGFRYFIAIIPLFIFLFLQGIYTAIQLGRKYLKIRISETVAVGGIVAFAVLYLCPVYAKALKPNIEMAKYKKWNAHIAGEAFAEFTAAMEWCGKNLPDSARVICRKPELYYIYSGGKKSGGFPQYGEPETILKSLIDNGATHVIIDHWFRHAYVTLYPLITEYYPQKFRYIGKFSSKETSQPATLLFEFNPHAGD